MSQTQNTRGRNDPCPCGSGKKYKQCCLDKDEAKLRKEREKAAAKAEKAAAKAAKKAAKDESEKGTGTDSSEDKKAVTKQPWKRAAVHSDQRLNRGTGEK